MAACCCKNDKTDRIAVSCLGRCDLPKHRCLDRDDIGPGPVPSYLGWLYTAKDSPDHQLRCGWRPGHISCSVLRRIEEHNCGIRCGQCFSCTSGCGRPCTKPCRRPYPFPPRCPPPSSCMRPFGRPCVPTPSCMPTPGCGPPPRCLPPRCPPYKCLPVSCYPTPCPSRSKCFYPCPPKPRCFNPCSPKPRCFTPCGSRTKCVSPCLFPTCFSPCEVPPCTKPMVRIIRHNGAYSIITKPDGITNHPSGPYPLKYVINTDDDSRNKDIKFSIEAKYNDQHFDYTSSQTSFVLDFSPPDNKCFKPCPRRSSVCFPCQKGDLDGDTACPGCGSKVKADEKKDACDKKDAKK